MLLVKGFFFLLFRLFWTIETATVGGSMEDPESACVGKEFIHPLSKYLFLSNKFP